MKKIVGIFVMVVISSFAFAQNNTQENDGDFITYHDNGAKNSTFTMEKGLLNGDVNFYFEDGNLKESGNFINSEKHGTWYKYNIAGIRVALANYNNGVKDGEWKVWNNDGDLLYHIHYKVGKKAGTWLQYSAAGDTISKKNY